MFIYILLGKFITIGPFSVILMLTAAKELLEDWKRHKADHKVNNANCQVFNQVTKKFEDVQWKNINKGDIVKIFDGSFFPADLILLFSNREGGTAYIETASLDGETNLKLRSAFPLTMDHSEDKVDGIQAE